MSDKTFQNDRQRDAQEQEFSVRIAYVDFDGAAALQALQRGETLDKAFLQQYCGRVVTAVDRLRDFII